MTAFQPAHLCEVVLYAFILSTMILSDDIQHFKISNTRGTIVPNGIFFFNSHLVHFYVYILTISVDTMAPMVFGCPDDISRTIELGSPDPQVAWVEPFATDASGTVELLFRSLGPGSTFAPGVTPVTYIFSDLTDNRGTCSFNIEIITGKISRYCNAFTPTCFCHSCC